MVSLQQQLCGVLREHGLAQPVVASEWERGVHRAFEHQHLCRCDRFGDRGDVDALGLILVHYSFEYFLEDVVAGRSVQLKRVVQLLAADLDEDVLA